MIYSSPPPKKIKFGVNRIKWIKSASFHPPMPCLVTEAEAIILTSDKSNFNLCEIFINFVEQTICKHITQNRT